MVLDSGHPPVPLANPVSLLSFSFSPSSRLSLIPQDKGRCLKRTGPPAG